MNQNPIFILGAHKSGTSLLRSIFDGHSELFVIPNEAHFFQHLGCWIDYNMRRQYPQDLSKKEIESNFISWIEKANTISARTSDSDTRNFWDIEIFKKSLADNMNGSDDIKSYIESYISAMYNSLYGSDLPNIYRVVEKSVDHAEFAV